ncbi:DUF2066 domain-containing protein [Succinimonas amylolytica]|uniref:DUF2066 domain-containing protein n=1 Tax=Succinimonas amylolytica TaxID=83769 RepID=UPI0023A90618
MKISFKSALFCSLLGLSGVSLAAGYTYKVPFDGDYDAAYSKAFKKMVTEVSHGATDPDSLRVNIPSLIASEDISLDGSEYIVVFDEAKVKRLISRGDISVWKGFSQPLVAWVLLGLPETDDLGEQQYKTSFITDTEDQFLKELKNAGSKNGVSLLVPVFDLDDMTALGTSDVMLSDAGKASTASARYSSGYALLGVLSPEAGGPYQFSYHIVNIAQKSEVLSNSVSGSLSQVAVRFYQDLKNNAALFSRKNVVDNDRDSQNGRDNSSDADTVPGYSHVEALGLGRQDDGSYRILVQGAVNFSIMKQIKDDLYNRGFQSVSIAEVKGGDVVYALKPEKNMSLEEVLAQEKVLVNRTQYVYLYNPKAFGRSSGTQSSGGSSGSGRVTEDTQSGDAQDSSSVSYDEAAKEIRERYRRDSGGSPNPNNRLHTGGGVVER